MPFKHSVKIRLFHTPPSENFGMTFQSIHADVYTRHTISIRGWKIKFPDPQAWNCLGFDKTVASSEKPNSSSKRGNKNEAQYFLIMYKSCGSSKQLLLYFLSHHLHKLTIQNS